VKRTGRAIIFPSDGPPFSKTSDGKSCDGYSEAHFGTACREAAAIAAIRVTRDFAGNLIG